MTALITGASSGIGREIARLCAADRHDVVLVARNGDALQALAGELTPLGVRADVIAADLSIAGSVAVVVDRVAALALDVDILVNSAGFGHFGSFVETPLEVDLAMILVNVAALTELTRRVLPPMVARRRGRILNLASTASFLPGPLMAVYYATKAYVLSFSEAIAEELKDTGVTVTALCPGPTASGFQRTAQLEASKLVADRTLPTPREVAEAGYAAMMAGQPLHIPGFANKLTAWAPRLTPRRLMPAIVRRAQEPR